MNSLQLILSNAKYFAPVWVFASLNIMIGTWVLYLPGVKSKFTLDDSELGIALFVMAVGTLVSLPMIPVLNKKFGTGRCTQMAIVLFAFSFVFPLLASSYNALCASLFLVGVCIGLVDISMNALVSEIEKADAQPFMSAAHGFFSLGGVIGAGLGSILLGIFNNPAWHMLFMALCIIGSNLLLSHHYIFVKEQALPKEETERKFSRVNALLGLSLIAFIIMCNEGAVEHWSNLYLIDIVGVSSVQLAGMGFLAFSVTMTIGRFFGDKVSAQFGAMRIILAGCTLALLAYLFILQGHFYSAVFGFALLGLGFSVIVPELFRLAGNTKGVPTSTGISVVSGVGFLGFLVGPVALGFISDATSLQGSYWALGVSVAVALVVSFAFGNPSD
jgi:fucose permease